MIASRKHISKIMVAHHSRLFVKNPTNIIRPMNPNHPIISFDNVAFKPVEPMAVNILTSFRVFFVLRMSVEPNIIVQLLQ